MPLAVATLSARPERLRIRVRGAVQGVGFRPFVYGSPKSRATAATCSCPRCDANAPPLPASTR